MTDFSYTWLKFWCALVFIFGIVLLGAGLPISDFGTTIAFGILGPSGMELQYTQAERFAIAISGSLSIGLALSMFAGIKAGKMLADFDTAKAGIIWRWLIIAILVWFVTDSYMSYATGFWKNVMSNCFILAFFMVPFFKDKLYAQ